MSSHPRNVSVRKRGLIVMMAVGLALTGCGSSDDTAGGDNASGEARPKITIGYQQNTMISAIEYITATRGFAEGEGLDAEALAFGSSPDAVASLLSGEMDVTMAGTGYLWSLADQGECTQFVGAGLRAQYELIARPELDIPTTYPESVQALKGKTIGVNPLGGTLQQMASKVLIDAGLDPEEDVTFIATGPPAAAITAFSSGQVDALMDYPPIRSTLGEGNYLQLTDLINGEPDILDEVVVGGPMVTCEYAEQNPEIVDSFCTAYSNAYEWAMDPANREEMVEVLVELLSVDEDTASELWEQMEGSFVGPDLPRELFEAQGQFITADLQDLNPDYDTHVRQCDR